MSHDSSAALLDAERPESSFEFEVTDVTRSRSFRARNVEPDLPAGVVARSLAAHLKLPDNVPWTLRSDSSSAFLDEESPIGEQIESGAQVTLSPVAHLGGLA